MSERRAKTPSLTQFTQATAPSPSASRPCVTITSPIIRTCPRVSPPGAASVPRAVLNTPVDGPVKVAERATQFRRGRGLAWIEN